ncbi:MAG: hypothetical protein ACFE9I_01495 [Candidatus Hermodarchaeota archaeon]
MRKKYYLFLFLIKSSIRKNSSFALQATNGNFTVIDNSWIISVPSKEKILPPASCNINVPAASIYSLS